MSTAVRRLLSTAPPPPDGAALRLFGYAICPFCHFVRSAARYTKTPLALTEVNPLTKAEIKFSTMHRKVPIAVFDDGSIVVESAAIVDELLRRSPPSSEDFSSKSARTWAAWATNELAPTVYPNITSTYSDCRRALAYADGAFGSVDAFLIKNVGALGLSLAHGKVKAKYDIDDEREALFEKLMVWEARIGERDGDSIDLADVAVHGVLGAVAGLPARDDVVEAHPKIGAWLERVEAALGGERVGVR